MGDLLGLEVLARVVLVFCEEVSLELLGVVVVFKRVEVRVVKDVGVLVLLVLCLVGLSDLLLRADRGLGTTIVVFV